MYELRETKSCHPCSIEVALRGLISRAVPPHYSLGLVKQSLKENNYNVRYASEVRDFTLADLIQFNF